MNDLIVLGMSEKYRPKMQNVNKVIYKVYQYIIVANISQGFNRNELKHFWVNRSGSCAAQTLDLLKTFLSILKGLLMACSNENNYFLKTHREYLQAVHSLIDMKCFQALFIKY